MLSLYYVHADISLNNIKRYIYNILNNPEKPTQPKIKNGQKNYFTKVIYLSNSKISHLC